MIRRLNSESGYSLVEVMVAIMLLGLAIIPMVSMFDAGLRAAVLGSNYDQARVTAGEELAEIQALPFDTSGDGTSDSVVEMYPPSSSPEPCSAPQPSFLDDCQVYTAYAAVGSSGIIEDSDSRKMIKVRVLVKWDGGNSYEAIGLVVEQSL
ncbi:hypothetical protein BH23ACT11_BH23ACT11_16040 [soil metagenome]